MSTRLPRGAAWLAVAAAWTLIAAACGGPGPTPSPIPTPVSTPAATLSAAQEQAIYAAIEHQVEDLRALKPTQPVQPVLLDETGLRAELARRNAVDSPPELLAKRERLLKALSALAPDASLSAFIAEFQGSQIAGFYVPQDGQLYVVSRNGGLGAVERTTFAHEYTHALQDQHFPLLDALDSRTGPDNGDRDLGRLALIEGDASVSMTYWAQAHLSPLDLLTILGSSLDPAQTAALNAMPVFLRETTLFPYQEGLQFVLGLQLGGGWPAVDAAFGQPPDTTEQVLHPEKFRLHEPAVSMVLPAGFEGRLGTGWTADSEDTLGELQLRALLTSRGVSVALAKTAAAGWGGDRVGLFQGPQATWVLVLTTAWDTPADVADFDAAARSVTGSGTNPSATVRSGNLVDVLIASDPATLQIGLAAVS